MDIGSLTGKVAIEDQFSGALSSVINSVQQFGGEFEGVLGGISIAVGATVAVIGGLVAAITAMAVAGSEINEVKAGFDRLSGSTENAQAMLEAMRGGVKGTISDLDLMRDSNRLLEAGVNANAADFGTMTAYAMTLSKEGLGPVSTTMGLVTTAMQRGRSISGPLKGALVDITAAEQEMSMKLAEQGLKLDINSKLIADRQGMLKFMQAGVDRAGDSELTFGQKLEQAHASFTNWLNDLESAVASSPELNTALDALGSALVTAFGGSGQDAIHIIVGLVNDFAIGVIDAGIGATQVATIFYAAWSLIKEAVLTVEAAVVGFVASLAQAEAGLESLAAKMPAVTGTTKDMAASAQLNANNLREMSQSLSDQAAKAAKGITGNSAFNKTLDTMAGALMNARDKMEEQAKVQAAGETATGKMTSATVAQTQAQKDATAATATALLVTQAHDKAVAALTLTISKLGDSALVLADVVAHHLTPAQEDNIAVQQKLEPLMQAVINAGGKLTAAESALYDKIVSSRLALDAKNLSMLAAQGVTQLQVDTEKSWGLTEAEVAQKLGVTTAALQLYLSGLKVAQGQLAAFQSAEMDLTKALNAANHDTLQGQLNDIDATTNKKIADLKLTQNYSLQTEQAIRDAAEVTKNTLILKNQESDVNSRAHYQLLADQAEAAYTHAAAAGSTATAQEISDLYHASVAAQDMAVQWSYAFGVATTATNTLISSVHKLPPAIHQATVAVASITTVLSNNFAPGLKASNDQLATFYAHMLLLGNMGTPTVPNLTIKMGANAAGAFANAIATLTQDEFNVFNQTGKLPTSTGFAEGGVVTVGENGPERVALPYGSTIFPNGTPASGGGTTYVINVTQPLGTPDAIAQAVGNAIEQRQRALGIRIPAGGR